jgi:hypothetical protein
MKKYTEIHIYTEMILMMCVIDICMNVYVREETEEKRRGGAMTQRENISRSSC